LYAWTTAEVRTEERENLKAISELAADIEEALGALASGGRASEPWQRRQR
jgi:hypothetical protein